MKADEIEIGDWRMHADYTNLELEYQGQQILELDDYYGLTMYGESLGEKATRVVEEGNPTGAVYLEYETDNGDAALVQWR